MCSEGICTENILLLLFDFLSTHELQKKKEANGRIIEVNKGKYYKRILILKTAIFLKVNITKK